MLTSIESINTGDTVEYAANATWVSLNTRLNQIVYLHIVNKRVTILSFLTCTLYIAKNFMRDANKQCEIGWCSLVHKSLERLVTLEVSEVRIS